MNADRIAELRALAEKATPGPWTVYGGSDENRYWVDNNHQPPFIDRALSHDTGDGFFFDGADAAFIAAARTALPEALDEIARLQNIFCRIEDLAHAADWFDFPKSALLELVGESGPWDAAALEGKSE